MKTFYEPMGFGLILTLENYPHEHEVNEQCRAKFVQHPSGHVDCLGIEWNAARFGKPDLWMPYEALMKHMRDKLAADMKGIIDEEDKVRPFDLDAPYEASREEDAA